MTDVNPTSDAPQTFPTTTEAPAEQQPATTESATTTVEPPVPATDLPRETAVEKMGKCPRCGAQTPAVTTPYGSVVQGACAKCSQGDQLNSQKAAANQGA